MLRSADREAGVTIVEVLVAIVILVVGALATFSLLSAANRNDERAAQTQVALDLAQQEIEALHGLSNKELALKTVPPHSSNEFSPNYRVNSAQGTFAVERSPVGSYHQLVRNGGAVEGKSEVIEGGVVEAGPTPFENGDVKGQIYRYIVWHNDERCGSSCGTSKQDYKQIIVAVKLDEIRRQGEERGYVEVQSDFVSPTASAASDPAPNANGEVVTAQQFFLSDTPCSPSGLTERAEIAGDHLLHNTLGTCASGLQTGTTRGAPDALVLGTPPDPDPEDEHNPPEYDYSADSYLEPVGANTDEGLQIRRDDTTGCHYVPTGTTHPESQVHRWVTDPMEAEFKMTEKVTLKIYSKTLSESTLSNGTICAYLFKRHETGSPPVAVDTRLTNASGGANYWTFTPEKNAYWNHYGPGLWGLALTLTMKFNGAPYTIPVGDRLGLAISVERGNTQTEALEFMYDNPTFPSRIEVDTSTPIEGG